MSIDVAPLFAVDVDEDEVVDGLSKRVVTGPDVRVELTATFVETALEVRGVEKEVVVVVSGLDAMLNDALVEYTVLMSEMATREIK